MRAGPESECRAGSWARRGPVKPGLGREPCMCVEWVGERVHEQNVRAGLRNQPKQATGVKPAGLIVLIVTTRCVDYIGSRGSAKTKLTAN